MKTYVVADRIIHLDGTGSSRVCIAINESGHIETVDAPSTLTPRKEDLVFDRCGYTALPLLADAHMHLGISDDLSESPQI